MNWYKKSQSVVAYHGTQSDFENFSVDYVGSGVDQEGPGIYFSSHTEDSSSYSMWDKDKSGGRVFKVILNFGKVVPLTGSANISEIRKMILWSMGLNNISELKTIDMDKYWESPLSNWSEDPITSFNEAVSIISNNSPHDAFQGVWIDFYRYKPVEYVNNMVKLGYDGVIVPKDRDGVIHYIVFNPGIIKNFFGEYPK